MTPDQIFDQVESTLEQIVNQGTELYIRSEREMRGTYPCLTLRILTAPPTRKLSKDHKLISSSKPEGTA